MKITLLFISVLFLFAAQPVRELLPPDEIIWSADRPLSWADFKGEAQTGSLTGAVTVATIRVTPTVVGFWNQRVEVEVAAIFRCDHSWAKDRARESTYLLNHEQRHFDIAEVFADRIRESLAGYRLTPRNYREIKEEVVEKLFAEYVAFDEAYDSETVHGLNKEAQMLWDQKIDHLLPAASFSAR